jgi:tektin-2
VKNKERLPFTILSVWFQQILQEMCKVEREIQDLEDALLDKTNKMKLAETRLENRTYRFGVELTRDDAQYGLTQEVLQLRAVQRALQAKVNDAKKALNMLLGFLQTLEAEIENKNEAKVIEQMALDVRGRVAAQAETPLTKTDRNIALSATVPVPEDRRKVSGELGRAC